jgi:hypothetical protein
MPRAPAVRKLHFLCSPVLLTLIPWSKAYHFVIGFSLRLGLLLLPICHEACFQVAWVYPRLCGVAFNLAK